MKAWLQRSGCLLLLVGCRQPNPDWEGPADADVGVDTVDPAETGPGKEETEGKSCVNENQCPDGWVCGPMGCQLGADGDPCEGVEDCQAPTSICSIAGRCQAGSEGDPCDEDTDCMTPTGLCGPAMTCQSGEAGQACNNPNHCATGLDCTDGVCG